MNRISSSDYKSMIAKASGQNKFRAKKTILGSHTFDSKAEATRYSELFILQQRGEITDLELQPEFPLIVNGIKVGLYKADFRYRDLHDRRHVEDVKSEATMTAQYRLKKKLVEAIYPGVEIEERGVKNGKSYPIARRQPKAKTIKAPRKRKPASEPATAAV